MLGCGDEPTPSRSVVERLPAREQLIRLSVDTRGVHPDASELAVIESNPDNYEGFVDRYLQDPRFLGRMREVFNQRYLTRTGDTYFSPSEAGIRGDSTEVAASLADEPLMLVSHIIENDLPWRSWSPPTTRWPTPPSRRCGTSSTPTMWWAGSRVATATGGPTPASSA